MKRIFLFALAISLISSWSCTRDPADSGSTTGHKTATKAEKSMSLTTEEGVSMLQIHCYTCHNPNAPSHDEMLAPPMVAVKWRYQKLYPDRETFIRKMTEFSFAPTREIAVMPGAVMRFGLMAKSPLNEETLDAISAFIYDHKLDEPNWFAEHFEGEHGMKWEQ